MNTQQFIGNYFEGLLSKMFNLERGDRNFSHKEPDLIGNTFVMEVKSSRFDNGGVIKGRQLKYLESTYFNDCLYAFPYHELRTPIWKHYPAERSLKRALGLKSLYIFPFSVAKARYETGYRRPYRYTGDDFVQINESLAAKIFASDKTIWEKLQLNPRKFPKAKLKGANNIFIMTEHRDMMDELLHFADVRA